MGSVIGKAGATIQALQAKHSSKIVTIKEMLPNSTERIVSVEGSVGAVDGTLQELARIVSEQDSIRLANNQLYQPGATSANTSVGSSQQGGPGSWVGGVGGFSGGIPRYGQNGSGPRRTSGGPSNNGITRVPGGAATSQAVPTPSNPDLRTQNISIPSDMVSYLKAFAVPFTNMEVSACRLAVSSDEVVAKLTKSDSNPVPRSALRKTPMMSPVNACLLSLVHPRPLRRLFSSSMASLKGRRKNASRTKTRKWSHKRIRGSRNSYFVFVPFRSPSPTCPLDQTASKTHLR